MARQASLFSQLLQPVPRGEFDPLVRQHAAEKEAKGFTCWTPLVAMLFCPLGRADSSQEICHGRACCVGNTSGWAGRPSACAAGKIMSCSRRPGTRPGGAYLLSLNPGSIVAMDRVYNDDPLFAEWTAAGLFFVTRLKDNADYEVTNERRGVVRDEANQR